jgi:hypothetical protein
MAKTWPTTRQKQNQQTSTLLKDALAFSASRRLHTPRVVDEQRKPLAGS